MQLTKKSTKLMRNNGKIQCSCTYNNKKNNKTYKASIVNTENYTTNVANKENKRLMQLRMKTKCYNNKCQKGNVAKNKCYKANVAHNENYKGEELKVEKIWGQTDVLLISNISNCWAPTDQL